MTITRLFLAITGLLLISFADSALAQSGGKKSNPAFANRSPLGSRPTISPYLNLLRQGNPALNYYGLVRPEREFRAANDQFRGQFGEVQQKLDQREEQDEASNLGVTGHRVRFLADQSGGSGGVQGALIERNQRTQKLPATPGSRIAPTGHGAYFSNQGSYYAFPNR